MKRTHFYIAAVLAVSAAVIGAKSLSHPTPISAPTPSIQVQEITTSSVSAFLHTGPASFYPDPTKTPGFTNPDITQGTISQTICNHGNWSTKSIRPPVSYTNALKLKQIQEYGFSDTSTANYEEDHFIALTIGGNPTDPRNLWPEHYPEAKDKDKVEVFLNKEICAGKISLQEAQSEITQDWYKVFKDNNL